MPEPKRRHSFGPAASLAWLRQNLWGLPAFLAVTAWLLVLVTAGTVAQVLMPPEVARQMFFYSCWIWVGQMVPLPGLPLALGFMAFNLAAQLVEQPLVGRRLGSWFAHAGVLLLVVSALASVIDTRSGYVVLAEGQTSRLWQGDASKADADPEAWPVIGVLPFSLTLEKFIHLNHPGTDIPATFSSMLVIQPDETASWRHTLTLNHPLHYHGYILYQASYVEKPGQPAKTVIAVVRDRTRLLPYAATFVLVLGLALSAVRRGLAMAVLAAALLAAPAMAQDATGLSLLPVQYEGRVQPLGAVAHNMVPFIAGRHMGQTEAEEQLSLWLLAPGRLNNVPYMKVTPQRLQQALALPAKPGNMYTVMEIMRALSPRAAELGNLEALPPEVLTPDQQNLLQLARRLETALMLGHTFTLLQPLFNLDSSVATPLQLKPGATDIMHLLARRKELLSLVEKNTTTSAAAQRQAMDIIRTLRDARAEQPNALVSLIPAATPAGTWLSPWQAAQPDAVLSADQRQALMAWEQLVWHYPVTQSAAWQTAYATLQARGNVPRWRLELELAALCYPLITWAAFPLLLCWLLLLLRKPTSGLVPAVLMAAGWLLLSLGLGERILILARPPVATLYESVIFVAWVMLTLGLLLGRRHSRIAPVTCGVALALVGIAHMLEGPEGTMGVLVAVLDTRLWLIAHVLTITGGYGLSLTSGYMYWYALWQHARRPLQPTRDAEAKRLHLLTLSALALTAAGTLLGGVWASQSWGRFWGWDPKENGALVLTLWLAMLVHVRLLKPPKPLLLLAMGALTPVVVCLAWFGVNLLNTGLHSYGFIHGVAVAVGLFCCGSVASVGGLLYMAAKPLTVEKQK
jgi:ABC-type transport system involved in cytochrome c biogenesis permease subunit